MCVHMRLVTLYMLPCSYKTDAVEFCSTEHTPRNLLIRAVKVSPKDTISSAELLGEYQKLKDDWGGVKPYLESLLENEMQMVWGTSQQK
jgi:hypothetical protein